MPDNMLDVAAVIVDGRFCHFFSSPRVAEEFAMRLKAQRPDLRVRRVVMNVPARSTLYETPDAALRLWLPTYCAESER